MLYALTLSHVCKQFTPSPFFGLKNNPFQAKEQKSVIACDDISLQLYQGVLLGLIGPNGSGKTTLIKILSSVILCDSGTATVNGFDVIKESLQSRRCIGVVFSENKNFYVRLSGRENLQLFASLYGLPRGKALKRIQALTDLLRIGEYMDKMFQENPSGIRQRFALARCLLNESPVILLDEPTKNLDPSMADSICYFIKNELVKKQRKTVLWASHMLSEIEQVADQVAILQKGRIKAHGTLNELRQNINKPDADLNDIYHIYLND